MGLVKDLVREIDRVVLPKHRYTRTQLNQGPPQPKPQPIGFVGDQQINFVPYDSRSACTLSDEDIGSLTPTPRTPTSKQRFTYNGLPKESTVEHVVHRPQHNSSNNMASHARTVPSKVRTQPAAAPIGIDKAKKTAMGSPRLVRKSIKVKVMKKSNQIVNEPESQRHDANDILGPNNRVSSTHGRVRDRSAISREALQDGYDARSIQSNDSFESRDSTMSARRESLGKGRPQNQHYLNNRTVIDSNDKNDSSNHMRAPTPPHKRVVRVLTKRAATSPGSIGASEQTSPKKAGGNIGVTDGNSINVECSDGVCGCQPTYGVHRCLTPPSYSDALLDEHVTHATHSGTAKTKVRRSSKSHLHTQTIPKSVIKTPKPRLTWNESTYIYNTYGGLGNRQGLDSYEDFSTMDVYDRRPFPCTYTSALSAEDVDNIKVEVGELHRELFGFYPEY
ncbi:hypothetical protein SARC_10892 [Sphaeroforma arctica JP610]|uniref:Uncharacterized protein n=1 Tax=Sphaeroforma arctica JP610 TaxID=667725 RepID=A0A0L0FIP5_9EUKA|nr:hypothetical protein SARC_10892 [Sphaeroforma arctica JP610]KNC76615.1 hypothetical protein SARC_10892 [Sphaeroforma arctica JP610]|eukprot:XP_014150517.1 hypothetical protein SARC_10892 [Sphaeroforma arctica JP610]